MVVRHSVGESRIDGVLGETVSGRDLPVENELVRLHAQRCLDGGEHVALGVVDEGAVVVEGGGIGGLEIGHTGEEAVVVVGLDGLAVCDVPRRDRRASAGVYRRENLFARLNKAARAARTPSSKRLGPMIANTKNSTSPPAQRAL